MGVFFVCWGLVWVGSGLGCCVYVCGCFEYCVVVVGVVGGWVWVVGGWGGEGEGLEGEEGWGVGVYGGGCI